MTTLAALVAELQSEVYAVNSVPTTTQYTQAIKDAVVDFSRRCGLAKMAELTIVANTATYSLASDFLSLIWLEELVGVEGVIVSPTGLIPLSSEWCEVYSIANKQITFTPTPTFPSTRVYRYKAAWIMTGGSGSETYTTMGDEEAQIIMIKAKQIAKEKQASALASSGGMKYSLGAVSVDKGSGAESLTRMMYELHAEFIQACERYNGSVGTF